MNGPLESATCIIDRRQMPDHPDRFAIEASWLERSAIDVQRHCQPEHKRNRRECSLEHRTEPCAEAREDRDARKQSKDCRTRRDWSNAVSEHDREKSDAERDSSNDCGNRQLPG